MYMRAFAEAWPYAAIVQQTVGQLPRGHNLVLLTKLKTSEQRLAYAQSAIAHGWSRNVLNIHIETHLLERSGKADTNFNISLPKPQSDLARESLKDPYRMDFLGLSREAGERGIATASDMQIETRLLELAGHLTRCVRAPLALCSLHDEKMPFQHLWLHRRRQCALEKTLPLCIVVLQRYMETTSMSETVALSLVNLRIPKSLHDRFAELAVKTHRSKSYYLRTALEAQIDQLEVVYMSEKRLSDMRAGKTWPVALNEILRELDVDG
jgi:predicted nuclease of restriction endonuclease-like (RecB) superfamily/predicted DNA-binding protein